MRNFSFSAVALSMCSCLVLSACGSSSSSDMYSREGYVENSARTMQHNFQPSGRTAPSLAYQQNGQVVLRSDVANLSCDVLVREDRRIAEIGQAINPTYEDMMRQVRLLEVRAALFSRCNRPSANAVKTAPQFIVPIQEAMSADEITQTRRAYAMANPQPRPTIRRNDYVSTARTAPPAIEVAPIVKQARRVQTVSVPVVRNPVTAPTQFVSAPVVTTKLVAGSGQYKTIQKFGNTTRVHYVPYDDLPLIAGPELAAQ